MSILVLAPLVPRYGTKPVGTRKIFMGIELKWLEINVFDIEMSLVSGFNGDFMEVE